MIRGHAPFKAIEEAMAIAAKHGMEAMAFECGKDHPFHFILVDGPCVSLVRVRRLKYLQLGARTIEQACRKDLAEIRSFAFPLEVFFELWTRGPERRMHRFLVYPDTIEELDGWVIQNEEKTAGATGPATGPEDTGKAPGPVEGPAGGLENRAGDAGSAGHSPDPGETIQETGIQPDYAGDPGTLNNPEESAGAEEPGPANTGNYPAVINSKETGESPEKEPVVSGSDMGETIRGIIPEKDLLPDLAGMMVTIDNPEETGRTG